MFGKLLIIGLGASFLATGANVSLADGDRWDRHDRRGYQNNHRKAQRWNYYNGRAYNWRFSPYYGPGYGQAWRYRYPNYNQRLGQAYLGGALIGSAIAFGIAHDNTHCNDRDHHHDRDRYRDTSDYGRGACYRIERLPDGRERRVELPASYCD